jgi:GNAT superfamily N-acetyltransferase
MEAGIQIHTADAADAEALTRVEIESKLQSIPQWIDKVEADHTARLERWKNYFAAASPQTSRPERRVLKALHNSKVIGYIAGHLSTRFSIDAEIQSFYVLKQYQGRKIGTALLLAFVDWLLEQHAKTLCVDIHPKNPYKAFYIKHGALYLNEHWLHWTDIHALKQTLDTMP